VTSSLSNVVFSKILFFPTFISLWKGNVKHKHQEIFLNESISNRRMQIQYRADNYKIASKCYDNQAN
jgi:hypothetical protein